MQLKKFLSGLDFGPSNEELVKLKSETAQIVEKLNQAVKKERISCQIFVGGSFAKGTLIKQKGYDVDVFVRFDWEYENLSDDLARIIKHFKGYKIKRMHGSRDYFSIESKGIVFEIIPVTKIGKPKEERNVTDLSYFHVNYVKSKIKGNKLVREIQLAKRFFHAQGVYGAESYINGFSGYAVECLIINYKSFEKMLKEFAKAKERLVLDPAKHFRKPEEALFELNESKIHGPIVLVDPTWKERNVLAALNDGTFNKIKETAQEFLRKPSIKFFEKQVFDREKMKTRAKVKKLEFLELVLKTDRQEGDIAGTKLKKFSNFLDSELNKYFKISEREFEYDERQEARIYLSVKSKGEIVRIGPPENMEKHASAFRKANKSIFVKNGILHARIKVNLNAKSFLKDWIKTNREKTKQMGIIEITMSS